MAELKISDFKMFEKIPTTEPELGSYTALAVQALGAEENIYGPVFTTRLIKHALRYIAQKFGEKTPEDIKTLSQLGEYLITLSEKHHTAYQTFLYAQFKTENEFQGQSGAAARIASVGFHKGTEKKPNVEERKVDLDNLLSTYRQTMIAMKVATQELGYKKNRDGSVDVIWPTCYFLDLCQSIFEEGLSKRPDGRLQCCHSLAMTQFFKLATGYDWDYDLLETYKPHCIARAYMI
nr:hypothetical protein [Candidatus Freyarchaeota archaeon]